MVEVKTVKQEEGFQNKEALWQQCMEIHSGYKQLNINSSEELQKFFDDKGNVPEYVQKANNIIFDSVEKYNSTEDEELKEKYKADAMYEQTIILQKIMVDYQKHQKLLNKINKANRKPSDFEKKKKANKKAKKSRSINNKRK